MPLIEAPPVQPAITTDLELFARAYFNIRLTRMQIQLIKDLAAGKEILMVVIGCRSIACRSAISLKVLRSMVESWR